MIHSQRRSCYNTTVCYRRTITCFDNAEIEIKKCLILTFFFSSDEGVTKPQRYIGIKGVIFDVTKNVAAYGPGTKYSVLVGRDASRALGKSSLKPEDTDITVSSDVSTLTEKQLQVLDDWYSFFSQRWVFTIYALGACFFIQHTNESCFRLYRYNIVGKVVDWERWEMPTAKS